MSRNNNNREFKYNFEVRDANRHGKVLDKYKDLNESALRKILKKYEVQ